MGRCSGSLPRPLHARRVKDRYVPFVVVLAPVVCGVLDRIAPVWWNYKFGYELLVFNGLLTACGLFLLRANDERVQK